MKKIISMVVVLAALVVPTVTAQKINTESFNARMEKSDADIANPKKAGKAATWLNRAKILQEAITAPTKGLYGNGLDVSMLNVILGVNPTSTNGDTYSYEWVDIYSKNKKVVGWKIKKEVIPNAFQLMMEAYEKAYELDSNTIAKTKSAIETLNSSYTELGAASLNTQNYKEAIDAYVKAIDLQSSPAIRKVDPNYYFFAGQLAAYLGTENVQYFIDGEKYLTQAKDLGFTDEQGNQSYLEHLVGIDKQTEAEEHDDLKQPRQSIHKGIDFLAVHDAGISHHDTGNIDCQIAVTTQQVGQREGEEDKRQQQDGVEGLVIDVQTIQHQDGELTQQVAGNSTYQELNHERTHYAHRTHVGRLGQLDKHYGKHIGHGVVTTAFQLQHRTEVVLQIDFLRTENGKYRSRIGRGHGSGQQQRTDEREVNVCPTHARKPPDEEAGKQSRQKYTHSGEHDTLRQHRLDVGKLGIHTARKKDDAQSNHTNELSLFSTMELNAQAIATKGHTHHQEQ